MMNTIKRKIGLLLCLAAGIGMQAQQVTESEFRSPFDFPLLLSANFGELRPNHFHNGLDIKTQGVTGKPIHSIADGYVSRVMVLHGGYGQAIFVTHPNGLTSLYGHVVSFAPAVQQYVRAYQYEHQTFTCDLTFDPAQFPVKAGDLIAMSGNEGSSAGPHLHLELRKTDTGEYIDPMPYFKSLLKDSKAPVASLVGFYPVPGEGVIAGSGRKKLVGIAALKQKVNAWGKIYTGISARDYMDGTSNFYGVHSVTLYVDSVQVFQSVTDKVLPEENRMINGFTDYDELRRTGRLIMRSYIAPGNRLRLLKADAERGVVCIDEERDYHFRYVLEDGFGNRRSYSFVVHGKEQPIPGNKPEGNRMLYWDRTNVIQAPGLEFVVPKYYVYENVGLDVSVGGDSTGLSFDYALKAGNTPLQSYCSLAIGVRHLPVADTSKYYVVQKVGKWRAPAGGTFDGGWMKTRVREFGTYAVALDTVAPRIVPVGQSGWRSSRNVRFKITDSESGIKTYKVFVDGNFVLFGLKKGILVIQDPEKVKRGVPHKVEVVVTDQCNNVARKLFHF
jgi:hypothetical protein